MDEEQFGWLIDTARKTVDALCNGPSTNWQEKDM